MLRTSHDVSLFLFLNRIAGSSISASKSCSMVVSGIASIESSTAVGEDIVSTTSSVSVVTL